MYESNGPDVKIRGTASHVAEKYLQLARDAQSSGDPIAAENYYQHAEHYFRLIAAAQEQLRQTQPYYQQQPGETRGADESYDEGEGEQPHIGGEPFAPREPQPYYPREQHNQPHHNQSQHNQSQHNQSQHNQPQHYQPQQHQQHFQPRSQHSGPDNQGDVDRLPSFITGGQPQQQQHGNNGPQGQNGPNGFDGQQDRFPLHRRRRRHRGGGGPREHSMDHSTRGDDDAPPPGSRSSDE
jgi:hypothetical protein